MSAQTPTVQWSSSYGTAGLNQLACLRPAVGGGYLLGGSNDLIEGGDRSQPSRGDEDYWVIKVDATGHKQWDQTLGGTGVDCLQDLQPTADGGCIVGGTSTSGKSGDKTQVSQGLIDYWIVKLDAQGTTQWEHSFGGTGNDILWSLQATADGGYLLAGTSNSPVSGDKTGYIDNAGDYWIVKLDSQGHKQWDRTIGAQGYEWLRIARQTPDGGYLLGGESSSGVSGDKTQPGQGQLDYWLVKLDGQGRKQWDRTYGGRSDEFLAAIQPTPDGGYLLGGTSESDMSGDKSEPYLGNSGDYWLIKVDAQGRKQWDRTIGGTSYDQLTDVLLTPDGHYLLGGFSWSGISGNHSEANRGHEDAWVVQVDAQGKVEWDRTFGSSRSDWLSSLVLTAANKLVIGGFTDSEDLVSQKLATHKPGDYVKPDWWAFQINPTPPTVKIVGDTAVCAGGQVQLTAVASPSPATFRWNTGATTATLPVTQAGTYQVSATFADGQVSTATHRVQVANPPLRIQGDTLLCAGQPLTLTALGGTSAVAYAWSTGATTASIDVTQPGVYSLTVHYSSGCEATQQVRVRQPTLQLQGPSLLCAGSRTTLEALAPGAVAYRWSTGEASSIVAITQPGAYSVTATFANGCTLSRTQQVSVPAAVIQGDSVLCAGQVGRLTAGGSPATAYQWSMGETTKVIRIGQPGLYSLRATSASGCSSTATWRVAAAPPLPAFTLGADTTLCEGTTLVLQAPMGNHLAYRWSDGSTAASLTVSTPGTYELVITTPCAQHAVTRRIAYQSCLLLPNVVTANGDGRNDSFAPAGLAAGPWELTIFNRWGRQVYTTTAYANDWGPAAAPGVYYYVLHQAATGVRYKGAVEIIR
ncbi:hypothetical protein HHL22_09525 [Hymenobacter sp. RP-2-7]|uniref:Gliding motility-associated C-terminal domain-containing protein n=1 Tax=Hymenobacter polaris TaxID=2682546 RepID=A0A7Y0FM35_9BACT|nr:gliding motility-associated C-terminal domain-containing protein [Hymenobacter polaris]NML65443.1 hypothetical protein [Hymenobacter polaris]